MSPVVSFVMLERSRLNMPVAVGENVTFTVDEAFGCTIITAPEPSANDGSPVTIVAEMWSVAPPVFVIMTGIVGAAVPGLR